MSFSKKESKYIRSWTITRQQFLQLWDAIVTTRILLWRTPGKWYKNVAMSRESSSLVNNEKQNDSRKYRNNLKLRMNTLEADKKTLSKVDLISVIETFCRQELCVQIEKKTWTLAPKTVSYSCPVSSLYSWQRVFNLHNFW